MKLPRVRTRFIFSLKIWDLCGSNRFLQSLRVRASEVLLYLITDTIDFNKHVHDIDIFINDKWRKYAGGDIGRHFKITRRLELRFWPTRKRSQPSQGNFFARIALQRQPCNSIDEVIERTWICVLRCSALLSSFIKSSLSLFIYN